MEAVEKKPLKRNLPRGFSIESFAEIYVTEALRIAEKNLSLDDFYNILFSDVASEIQGEVDLVRYLHHAFHWNFFNGNDGSIFKYEQSRNPFNSADSKILLIRPFEEGDASQIVK